MRISDPLYGVTEIPDQVLVDLLQSQTLNRLRDIDLAGYFEPKNTTYTKSSRYTHSVGVMLLLRKFGASIEEQIAGLIHDVSHSAFSHCIDYVLAEGTPATHAHQDSIHDRYVKGRTDIPKILSAHHISIDKILNDSNFPLKENNIPNICADRIDYSLRTAVGYQVMTIQESQELLSHVRTIDTQWVFENYESARKFADIFSHLNTVFFSGFRSTVMFQTVGMYLKYALDAGYISRDDLYTTDKEVLAKIVPQHMKDKTLSLYWDRMNGTVEAFEDRSSEIQVTVKSRIVDPLFLKNEQITRVSDVDAKWKETVSIDLIPKVHGIRFAR